MSISTFKMSQFDANVIHHVASSTVTTRRICVYVSVRTPTRKLSGTRGSISRLVECVLMRARLEFARIMRQRIESECISRQQQQLRLTASAKAGKIGDDSVNAVGSPAVAHLHGACSMLNTGDLESKNSLAKAGSLRTSRTPATSIIASKPLKLSLGPA